MIILALDTALASCSACVFDSTGGVVLAEERQFMERGHAEALPPMVARVMAKAGVDYGDLKRIALTTGPGTFTGIRIGLSFARALGLARNIKVLGLNTMIATRAAVSQTELPIIVAHKAGASAFLYLMTENEVEILKLDEAVAKIPRVAAILVGTAADDVVAASGRDDLQRLSPFDLPSASGFVSYAALQPDPVGMPDPVYLREADAKPQANALRDLPDLKIGFATADDIPALAKLHAICFDEAWDEAMLAKLLSGPGCGILLAQSAEGPVGLLIFHKVADEAEILTLGVDPNLQRRGAGRSLLDGLIASLKVLDVKSLFLEVASSNDEAIRLYRKAGFAQAGLRKAYYARKNAPAEDALILRCELS
jgi:tRNA threonylcarbamoyl adenosine modification protein YeaZ/ribosomal-protein-alanine acetyltransferase